MAARSRHGAYLKMRVVDGEGDGVTREGSIVVMAGGYCLVPLMRWKLKLEELGKLWV